MQAGFAKVDITPALGTPLMGYGVPRQRLAARVNDPLYARILWAEHGGKAAVIIGVDFCFIGREDYDRLTGQLSREVGLLADQVMIVATHSHAAPAMGNYLDLEFEAPLRDYIREFDAAVINGIKQARDSKREVTVRAGKGKSSLPVNRRQLRDGKIVNGPNPAGTVHDALPVCLLEDREGKPVCLLFSTATHVVCMNKLDISADYPGVVCDELEKHLGTACAIFLQGPGGDSRPRQLVAENGKDWNWQCGWKEAQAAGKTLAAETIVAMKSMRTVEPRVASAILETRWPLQCNITREQYAKIAEQPGIRKRWAEHNIALLDRGTLPKTHGILLQGIRLGKDLRVVALEGEPLHPWGRMMENAFDGLTFALGYANGEGAYLVTSPMLDEGGYEPESFWEYNLNSSLAKGMESVVEKGLAELKARGI